MHYLYNNKIRIIFTFIWILLFSYFLYSWAKDDKTFEVGVAFLALFAPSVFSMIFPSKKDTFLIDTNRKVLKSENIIKHGLDIEYPFIRYNDNTAIEKKINSLIENIYLRHGIDIKKNKIIEDSLGEVNSKYEITYKNENLLCIKFTNFIYYDGAAHGNVEIITLNVNLFTGEEFEFKDIFRSDAYEEITAIVKEKLLSLNSKDTYFDFDSINLRSNHNFYLNSSNNLVIVFFKYEIACGACGPIEIEIDINEFKNYINPNGPLLFMYNKYVDSNNIDKGHTMNFALGAYMKINKKFNDDEYKDFS